MRSPSSVGSAQIEELISNRFMRKALFRYDIEHQIHSYYQPLLFCLNIKLLASKQNRFDICLIFKLLKG